MGGTVKDIRGETYTVEDYDGSQMKVRVGQGTKQLRGHKRWATPFGLRLLTAASPIPFSNPLTLRTRLSSPVSKRPTLHRSASPSSSHPFTSAISEREQTRYHRKGHGAFFRIIRIRHDRNAVDRRRAVPPRTPRDNPDRRSAPFDPGTDPSSPTLTTIILAKLVNALSTTVPTGLFCCPRCS